MTRRTKNECTLWVDETCSGMELWWQRQVATLKLQYCMTAAEPIILQLSETECLHLSGWRMRFCNFMLCDIGMSSRVVICWVKSCVKKIDPVRWLFVPRLAYPATILVLILFFPSNSSSSPSAIFSGISGTGWLVRVFWTFFFSYLSFRHMMRSFHWSYRYLVLFVQLPFDQSIPSAIVNQGGW